MAISPAKMFADIAATAARFRAVPAKVATETAARLSASMTQVAANRGHKRHGDASPVPDGVLIHAYTRTPGVGTRWMGILGAVAKKAMTDAANGSGGGPAAGVPSGAQGGNAPARKSGGAQGRDSSGRFGKKG